MGAEGETVLGCLLADGTAAADRGAVKHVLLFHLAKFIIIEAVVVKELLVFGSYDGTDHIVGYALKRNPCALERAIWPSDAFNAALDHEWSHCDRYPLQEGDQQNTGHHKPCRDVRKNNCKNPLVHITSLLRLWH